MKTDWNDDQWEKVKWFNPFSIMVFIIFGSIFIAIGILGYIDYIWVIAGGSLFFLHLASRLQISGKRQFF